MNEPIQCSYCRQVEGRGIPLPGDDIDTDRIIPARYMKSITFEGLGYYAFHEERYDEAGDERPHPFNDQRYHGGEILIVNRNFGCGSSREHAPQSLMDFGITGIVGESFAEIFAGNCTAIGIPAVRVQHDDAAALMSLVREHPLTVIRIDLETRTVTAAGMTFDLDIDEAYRQALVTGTWDSTSTLLANLGAIGETAVRIPYISGFDT